MLLFRMAAKPFEVGQLRGLFGEKIDVEALKEEVEAQWLVEEPQASSGSDSEEDESVQTSVKESLPTLFVGNVPLGASLKKLRNVFTPHGEVKSIRLRSVPVSDLTLPRKVAIAKKKINGEHRKSQNAYVVFSDEEIDLTAVSEKLNNYLFEGHHLRVDAIGSKRFDESRSVFIGNLPFDTEEEDVRRFFVSCGCIRYVRLIRDKKTNIGKGFGYVAFEEKEQVKNALTFNGTEFKSRQIRVFRCNLKAGQKKRSTSTIGFRDRSLKRMRSPSFQGLKASKPVSKKLKKK